MKGKVAKMHKDSYSTENTVLEKSNSLINTFIRPKTETDRQTAIYK